jgi:hypothetical protein
MTSFGNAPIVSVRFCQQVLFTKIFIRNLKIEYDYGIMKKKEITEKDAN